MIQRHPDILAIDEASAMTGITIKGLRRGAGPPPMPAYRRPMMWHRATCRAWIDSRPAKFGVPAADRRAMYIEKLGGACAVCGSVDRLEFDHIDPSTKIDVINFRWAAAKVEAEVAKCQLLCRTCHQRKSAYESKLRYGCVRPMDWTTIAQHLARCDECAARVRRCMEGA